ncbi:hypothetical protein ABPG72_015988 [Tetrahymena utriculariae]
MFSQEINSLLTENSKELATQTYSIQNKEFSYVQDLLKQHKHIKTLSTMKILSFANGVYQGHINQDNQLNGLGVFFWKNSQIYYGQWQLSQMAGRGIIVFPQGGYVYGHFKNNLLEGKFKLIFPNKDTMFAYCSQGFFQGKAIRKFKDSSQYIECQYDKGNMISIDYKLTKDQFKHRKKLEFNELVNMKEFFEHISQSKQYNQNVTQFNQDYDIYDQFNNQIKCLMINNEEIYFGSTKFNFPRGYGVKIHLKSNLIQRGRFLDGLLDGRGRKNFLNGDIYDGGFTEGQISNSGLFYDNTNFSCYRGFFEYNKLVTLFAIFQTRFPNSQYDYEKQDDKDIDCNLEIQSESIYFTQKEALFMISTLHSLGQKYILNKGYGEDYQKNNELIELYKLKSSFQQQQVKYIELKTFQQEQTIDQMPSEKNQSQNQNYANCQQSQNVKAEVDANQKVVNKKSTKSLLPPLSRKASLLEGQQGNYNAVSTSVLNSTQPFSSQYNSNTSSNTTFIQQNQGEFLNTENNSQQSNYFSKFRSNQQANQENNLNTVHISNQTKKVSFCDEIKTFNTQINKTTKLQNSILNKVQNSPSNQNENIISQNKNLNKSKEESIIIEFKDQQIQNQYQKQEQLDCESNNYDFFTLNDNSMEMQKQNIDNSSVIFEKSIDIYDSNQNLYEINVQNEINLEVSNIASNKQAMQSQQIPSIKQKQFINQEDYDQSKNNYLQISPQNEQKESFYSSSSSKLYSSDFSQTNNNNQKENTNQQNHQLQVNGCQSIKNLTNQNQNEQKKEKLEFDQKDISNYQEKVQMNYIYKQNYGLQEEEESRKKKCQKHSNNQIILGNSQNSNKSIDNITKSVQFYDSDQNYLQSNKSDIIVNHQNCLLQNISFEQYFQILSQNQNIQQESGQFTLTFSKNNDSTNQCFDQMNHNRNHQSHKQISQNFLVGTLQDCVKSLNDVKEQRQTRNDFSSKLKQIVQHKQIQFDNQQGQGKIEKIDQKTIASENQIVDSNITTDQSYSYHQFKLQNQNQQQKTYTSNIAYEKRFSFCNNTSFKDDLHQCNQSQNNYFCNNIEQKYQLKDQRRNANQLEINKSFKNKENISSQKKYDKCQQNQKTNKKQQKVKVVHIDLLQELSQNFLKFNADKYEENNVYVPQLNYNENQQQKNLDYAQLSQPLQYDYYQKQSVKNINQTYFYKSNHRKQNSEIQKNVFEEAQQQQRITNKMSNLNPKLYRKQSTGSLHINHSNQIQKMVSSKSQTLLKQMSSGDLHSKNNCEEISTKILKQISNKQFQGQKAIFQKLIEFKYINKLAQMS